MTSLRSPALAAFAFTVLTGLAQSDAPSFDFLPVETWLQLENKDDGSFDGAYTDELIVQLMTGKRVQVFRKDGQLVGSTTFGQDWPKEHRYIDIRIFNGTPWLIYSTSDRGTGDFTIMGLRLDLAAVEFSSEPVTLAQYTLDPRTMTEWFAPLFRQSEDGEYVMIGMTQLKSESEEQLIVASILTNTMAPVWSGMYRTGYQIGNFSLADIALSDQAVVHGLAKVPVDKQESRGELNYRYRSFRMSAEGTTSEGVDLGKGRQVVKAQMDLGMGGPRIVGTYIEAGGDPRECPGVFLLDLDQELQASGEVKTYAFDGTGTLKLDKIDAIAAPNDRSYLVGCIWGSASNGVRELGLLVFCFGRDGELEWQHHSERNTVNAFAKNYGFTAFAVEEDLFVTFSDDLANLANYQKGIPPKASKATNHTFLTARFDEQGTPSYHAFSPLPAVLFERGDIDQWHRVGGRTYAVFARLPTKEGEFNLIIKDKDYISGALYITLP